MLTIRLQRVGRTHQPDYRIVLAEKHRSATKKAVEVLGSYNPQSKSFAIKDESRLKHWLDQHVEVSPTVWNLFVSKSLVEGKKIKAWQPKVKEKEEEATVEQKPLAEKKTPEADTAPEAKEEKTETPKAEDKKEESPA